MTETFDVVVVGAGPAGATVAAGTAGRGLSTILLERRRALGEPVLCGELLPTPSEMGDLFPRSPRGVRLTDVPRHLILDRTRTIRLISPRGRRYEFRFSANIIDRARFDPFLVTVAEDAGAELRLCNTVVRRNRDNTVLVRTPDGISEIRGRVVVGADGPVSVVARSIGVEYKDPSSQLSQSASVTLADVDTDVSVVEMFFGSSVAPGGYAWVIPRGPSEANVGLGLRPAFAAPGVPPRRYLHRFILSHTFVARRLRGGRVVRQIGALIPVDGPVERTYSDEGVLLVGDAAGHVMASNGGGIPTALIGGEIAAESIVNHLEFGTPLSAYEKGWKQEFGRELYTALSIRHIADKAMTTDAVTEVTMRLAGTRLLEQLIRCRLPLPVDIASRTLLRALMFLL